MELASAETTQVDAQAEAWFASYTEASDEPLNGPRRVRHGHRRGRGSRQVPRRRGDTLLMVASFVFVGVMTACFYAVLTR